MQDSQYRSYQHYLQNKHMHKWLRYQPHRSVYNIATDHGGSYVMLVVKFNIIKFQEFKDSAVVKYLEISRINLAHKYMLDGLGPGKNTIPVHLDGLAVCSWLVGCIVTMADNRTELTGTYYTKRQSPTYFEHRLCKIRNKCSRKKRDKCGWILCTTGIQYGI